MAEPGLAWQLKLWAITKALWSTPSPPPPPRPPRLLLVYRRRPLVDQHPSNLEMGRVWGGTHDDARPRVRTDVRVAQQQVGQEKSRYTSRRGCRAISRFGFKFDFGCVVLESSPPPPPTDERGAVGTVAGWMDGWMDGWMVGVSVMIVFNREIL